MRKEIIFAIIIGVLVGAVLAFGIWRVNLTLKNGDESSNQMAISVEESASPQETELKITLSNPEDFDVITQNPTVINGLTRPNSWVVISGEEEDYIFKSDNNGVFETEIELVGGINRLIMYAFDDNNTSEKHEVTLVYSTEFIADSSTQD